MPQSFANISNIFLGSRKEFVPTGGVKVFLKKQNIALEIGKRSLWQFLSFGVPRLIETLSIFLHGIIHREQTGIALCFKFKDKYLDSERISVLKKFYEFNEVSQTPLNQAQSAKVFQIVNQAITLKEKSLITRNEILLKNSEELISKFIALLHKNAEKKATRKNFNLEDWNALDVVDYKLAKEHFLNLVKVFNSLWFYSLRFQQEMKNHFGVNYCEALIAEGLSLSLSYIQGLDGKKIWLPFKKDDINEPYRAIEYRISETFLGDSLPCYVLESNDPEAHPWFVIRGTQPYIGLSPTGKEYRIGSFESILADAIDPAGIASDVIKKGAVHRPLVKIGDAWVQKESLFDLFKRWKDNNQKVILAGHSLGGYLINNLAVRYYDDIKTAYGFSSAGIDRKIADKWEKFLESRARETGKTVEELEKKIVNIDYEGDFIPAGGGKLIGLHLAIEPQNIPKDHGWYHSHIKCHLNQNFKISKVDLKKENSKFSRTFCETVRIIIGLLFRVLLNLFSPKSIPDWWINREHYGEQYRIQKRVLKRLSYIQETLYNHREGSLV